MFEVKNDCNLIDFTSDQLILNQNGKRPHEDNVFIENNETAHSQLQVKINKLNDKKIKFKKRKHLKSAEKKSKPPPVYSEHAHPAQLLNELHRNLIFNFDIDTTVFNKMKYLCNVKIKQKLEDSLEENDLIFTGDGLSKKDAKRKCCFKALITLYGDTYKPPADVIESLNPIHDEQIKGSEEKMTQKSLLEDLNKRIPKICNKNTIKFKSPAQLLYELCKNISDTGECVIENGKLPGQKYTYQFKNVDSKNSVYGVAYGFGNSKKEAKNQAAKQALKIFLNCDLDQISSSMVT